MDVRLSNYTPLPLGNTQGSAAARALKPVTQQPAQPQAPASTALTTQPSEILNLIANNEGRGKLVDIMV